MRMNHVLNKDAFVENEQWFQQSRATNPLVTEMVEESSVDLILNAHQILTPLPPKCLSVEL